MTTTFQEDSVLDTNRTSEFTINREHTEVSQRMEDGFQGIPKEIIYCFEDFQRSRVEFVRCVADLTLDSRNMKPLFNGGVVELLKPLLVDHVPSVQIASALALGRIASHSTEMAEHTAKGPTLHTLVHIMPDMDSYFKRAACYLLRSVAKSSPKLARAVVDAGAVESFVSMLEVLDSNVREAAIWGLDYIARHNAELAQAVVDNHALSPLLMCVQEPELPIKRISVCILTDICKHSEQLTQRVIDLGAVQTIAPLFKLRDVRLNVQILAFMAQVAKHSPAFAQLVAGQSKGKMIRKVVKLCRFENDLMVKNATTCLRAISKHNPDLAGAIIEEGGLKVVHDILKQNANQGAIYSGVRCITNIARFNKELADQIIDSGVLKHLARLLDNKKCESYIRVSTAICFSAIGGHSLEQCYEVGDKGVFNTLFNIYLNETRGMTSSEISAKLAQLDSMESQNEMEVGENWDEGETLVTLHNSLKTLIGKCSELTHLQPLVDCDAPEQILLVILAQLKVILEQNAAARSLFTRNGGLALLQQMLQSLTIVERVKEEIHKINTIFPEEAVNYWTPGYDRDLLNSITI